jgi:hypothetical protein
MQTKRIGPCAVRLADGRVLVMGGARAEPSSGNVLASCEIYDPKTNTWTPTGSLHSPRRAFRAVVLNDGKVLAIGGDSGPVKGRFAEMAKCEVYDPATGEWNPTGSLMHPRWGPTATVLADGRVLATGGMRLRGGRLGSTELYDPATREWTEGPPLKQARNGHRAITLNDGRVLIVGGYSGYFYLSSCEIYLP